MMTMKASCAHCSAMLLCPECKADMITMQYGGKAFGYVCPTCMLNNMEAVHGAEELRDTPFDPLN